ncbi:hypothetical protein [Agromyces ramosus]|uniref:Uncharacterized protein n=1 Tax=Agromyces ramosus TaxID=33879 RepID=A0ABU0R9Z9_9MICO|nr:hypothetical protein [Agromyces ramosus]MDQ0894041.1 hypothetical protein [Agromyces ramosus]
MTTGHEVQQPTITPASDHPRSTRPLPRWLLLLIGVGSAVFGLLPWLITGLRLPLQNLWATDTLPGDMPLVLLPFSQYAVSLIVAVIVIGSAAAGVVARSIRRRTPKGGLAMFVLGVAVVDLVALTQTAVVVGGGLRDDSMSSLYLTALLACAGTAIVLGLGVLALIARAPRGGAVIGLAVPALLSSVWLHALLSPQGPAFIGEPSWLFDAVRWAPPVLIGAAIAWGGVNTVGRLIAAVASLLMLWITPALLTAVANAVGSRVLARYLGEMLDYGISVFRAALFEPNLAVPPLVVAVVVAGAGIAARMLLTRRALRQVRS